MIFLEKFTPCGAEYGRYAFDPDTNTFRLSTHETYAEAAQACSGFADEREVGLLRRRRVFVATYLHEEGLVLLVDDHTFRWPGPYRVRRRTLLPFVKSFEVLEGDRVLLRLVYCYYDLAGFPGTPATDIFLHAAEDLATPASVARAVYWFRARAAGRNVHTDAFLKEVEDYVAATTPHDLPTPTQT